MGDTYAYAYAYPYPYPYPYPLPYPYPKNKGDEQNIKSKTVRTGRYKQQGEERRPEHNLSIYICLYMPIYRFIYAYIPIYIYIHAYRRPEHNLNRGRADHKPNPNKKT